MVVRTWVCTLIRLQALHAYGGDAATVHVVRPGCSWAVFLLLFPAFGMKWGGWVFGFHGQNVERKNSYRGVHACMGGGHSHTQVHVYVSVRLSDLFCPS